MKANTLIYDNIEEINIANVWAPKNPNHIIINVNSHGEFL